MLPYVAVTQLYQKIMIIFDSNEKYFKYNTDS